MGIAVRFDDRDWARVASAWECWWRGESARPMVLITRRENPPGRTEPMVNQVTGHYPLDMPADDLLDLYQADLETEHYYGDAFPKWWPNFGPGMLAGFLGAVVRTEPHTVWFEPPKEISLEKLNLKYNAKNRWWRRVRELTSRAVERWGGKVAIAHTDLGGNLDVLASFRGSEQLLMEMAELPEEVLRVSRQITRLWLRYYDELHRIISSGGRGTTPWAAIWSPQRCYMLQCDLSYMFSPAMFERLVRPDLETCCRELEHGFYHLDGRGQIAHLDLLLKMKELRGIQWIPGDGQPTADGWLDLLKRIVDAGKLCQVYVPVDGARRIVQGLGGPRGAGRMAITIWGVTNDDQARALVEELGAGD
ncbi:MAG: hypothetical protein IT443_10395 [Phycisphaeraceae bacterium]|nr:hypothetical protein [Phycisphaeraceae bacterium]